MEKNNMEKNSATTATTATKKNNRNRNRNRVEANWTPDGSDVFLARGKKGLEVYDTEVHANELCQVAGGKIVYVSNTGMTGTCLLTDTDHLIRVGQYSTGNIRYDWHQPVEVSLGISVMFPGLDRAREVLKNRPVVIIVEGRYSNGYTPTVIYTRWQETFEDTLKKVLKGQKLEGKLLEKTFRAPGNPWSEVTKKIIFVNLFGGYIQGLNPWKFITDDLKGYEVCPSEETPHRLLGLVRLPNGKLATTFRIEHKLYVKEVLDEDPCVDLEEAPAGWHLADQNLIYCVRHNEVQVVGWVPATDAYFKRIRRELKEVPSERKESFLKYLNDNQYGFLGDYVSWQVEVSRMEFILDPRKAFAEIRREIAESVRENLENIIHDWKKVMDAQEKVSKVPDGTRIRIGRGTEFDYERPLVAIKKRFFPGTDVVLAKDLKAFSLNREVLEVLLRYIPRET